MTASLAGAGHAPADAWMVLVLGLSVAGRVALVGLVGCLVLALLVCHEGSDGPTGSLLESASRWAAAWSATPLLLLGLEIWSPAAVSRGAAGPDAGDLAARLRWLVVSAGLALLVHVLARACRTRRDVAVVLGVVVPAVWVGVGLGHGGPVLSPTALGIATTVHVLAACAWTGGLLALVTHRSAWAGPRARLLHAYSNVALAAFVALAASGVLGLALRTSWDQLQGGGHYVALVGTKAALLVLLGACGACQRRVLLRRVDRGEPGAFLTMAAGELVLLGMATGLAVALAHSAG
jgi:putative copper resistance protein D